MAAIPRRLNPLQAVWLSLRPHQWTKNLVVFAAPALSMHLFERGPLEKSVLGFVIFCALSGTVYLLTDVADLERDRLHPRKRLRPIASGALSPRAAVLLSLGLGLGSLGLSALLGLRFVLCAALYLALNILYSFRLKEIVILDVLSVSIGFVLRAWAGGEAIE
jgi:4-hydroxybenzoate polyprenyltransferase